MIGKFRRTFSNDWKTCLSAVGLAVCAVAARAEDPDMMSIHLMTQKVAGVERNVFGRHDYTVRRVLEDLDGIVNGVGLDDVVTRFGGRPRFYPIFTTGSVSTLGEDLSYLLDEFPLGGDVYSQSLAVGEKSYVDEYGNYFTTTEPYQYEELPYSNTVSLTFYAGCDTAAAAGLGALMNVEIVTRGQRYLLHAFGDAAEVTRYDRDEAGRLVTAFYAFDTNEAAIHCQYDPNGNRLLKLEIARNDLSMDSNGNHLPDLWQLRYFPDLSQTGAGDPDGDGVVNSNEYVCRGNPTRTDTDDDAMNDLQEFIAGTALDDPRRYFRVERILAGGGTSVVQWIGVSNRNYQFQAAEPIAGTWTNAAPLIFAPTNGTIEMRSPEIPDRFYRIIVIKP